MEAYGKIREMAEMLEQTAIVRRRDFHKFTESGWYEMRTSSKIARVLADLGYEVLTGRAVCEDKSRMGLPSREELAEHFALAVEQGADMEYMTEDMKAGFTGVIGILRCGEGPVVAMRFDIDALGGIETEDENHKPNREGFASVNHGYMHACGHDGHAVIGLAVAEILMNLKDELHGTVKLIFQPAEEGVKGAKSIVENGHLDDVDYFLCGHIFPEKDSPGDDVIVGTVGAFATCKYNAAYHGKAMHAGSTPQLGQNALMAAVSAVQNLMAISRHTGGTSLVNIGKLNAGTARNVIPDEAFMEVEIRGETTEILEFMKRRALTILQSAATMHDCTVDISVAGEAEPLNSDQDFAALISEVLSEHAPQIHVSRILDYKSLGSEDASFMMNRTQAHGGKATYMRLLTDMKTGVHERNYDFDEQILKKAMVIFSTMTCYLMSQDKGQKN